MVRRLCIGAVALALVVVSNSVQAQDTPFFQRSDGTYGYVVQENDDLGQWQIALGDGKVWNQLKRSNPQLANPDRIWPGDTLNVPPTLVRTFEMLSASTAANASPLKTPPITGIGSADSTKVPPPPVVASSGTPWALWAILALLVIAVIVLLWQRATIGRERRERHEAAVRAQTEARQQEREREMADPFSGPPVREGGLPTIEAAEQFFAEAYRAERGDMTVTESNRLPASIAIERIVPIDVRGPMLVDYHDHPRLRNLPRWTPAWQAFLSDGTFRISLMGCANDVRAGEGMQPLPGSQIRPRQDVPERIVNRQIWPEIAPTNVPAEIPTEIVPLQFASVRFDGPMRLIFQPGGQVLDLGPLVTQGVRISVGVQNGEVIVDNNGQRVVFGWIVGEQPPSVPVALPAGTSAETSRQIAEILAHVPADEGDRAIVAEAPTSVPGGNG